MKHLPSHYTLPAISTKTCLNVSGTTVFNSAVYITIIQLEKTYKRSLTKPARCVHTKIKILVLKLSFNFLVLVIDKTYLMFEKTLLIKKN